MTRVRSLLRIVLWWVVAALAAAGIGVGWLLFRHEPVTARALSTPMAVMGCVYLLLIGAVGASGPLTRDPEAGFFVGSDQPLAPEVQRKDRHSRSRGVVFSVGAAICCFLFAWLLGH